MPVRVVTVAPMPRNVREPLEGRFGSQWLPPAGEQRDAFVAEHAATIEVAVANAGGGVDADLMDALPNLRAIVHFAVGYDSTDVAAARQRGIAISNTPDVLTDCTADLAVGLTLDTMRQITAGDRFIRTGRWSAREHFPLTRRVTGSHIGILGLGRIGHAVAHRLAGFDCAISYHSRSPVPNVPYRYYDSPIALASAVQTLVVVVPGGPGTENLVGPEVLTALGSEGFLINIARGSVVDEQALLHALTHRTIAGAGLDVFSDEPNVPEAFWERDNIVLAPHIGSATVETRQDMADLVISNVESWLTHQTLVTPV